MARELIVTTTHRVDLDLLTSKLRGTPDPDDADALLDALFGDDDGWHLLDQLGSVDYEARLEDA